MPKKENYDYTAKERQRRATERKKDAGLWPVKMWVPKKHIDKIKTEFEKIIKKFEDA